MRRSRSRVSSFRSVASAPETINARAGAELPERAIPQSAGPPTQAKQARTDVLHALPVKLVVNHGGSRVDIVRAPRGCAPWRVEARVGEPLRCDRRRGRIIEVEVGARRLA